VGSPAAEKRAIEQMAAHYKAAEKLAFARARERRKGLANAFYPAMNRIAAQLAQEGGRGKTVLSAVATVRRSIEATPADFWTVVGQVELDVYIAVATRTLSKPVQKRASKPNVARLVEAFTDHYDRTKGLKSWGSVYDNAQFVLLKYRRRATAKELGAVDALLETLAGFAGQKYDPPKHAPRAEGSVRDRLRRGGKS